jgi:hypothetical protein
MHTHYPTVKTGSLKGGWMEMFKFLLIEGEQAGAKLCQAQFKLGLAKICSFT